MFYKCAVCKGEFHGKDTVLWYLRMKQVILCQKCYREVVKEKK